MTRGDRTPAARRFSRRRRRLRFTREGKYFVALTLAVGFAAINTGNNLLFLVLGTMLTLIIGSGILSEQTLRSLTISRQLPRRVFAGQPVLVGTNVCNDKNRISSFSIEVEDLLEGQPLDKKCYFLKVLPGRTQQTSYRHTFERRGIHRFEGHRLSTRFPFSLFCKSREMAAPDEVVVYPRLVPVTPDPVSGAAAHEDRLARVDRRGEDFHSLREMREGDDHRDICWRKSAGANRPLLVRQGEQPSGRRVVIVFDNSGEPDSALSLEAIDRRERTVSRAASLAADYLRRGYAVGLHSRTVELRAATGEVQLDRILRALAVIDFVPADRPMTAPAAFAGETLIVGAADGHGGSR